MISAAELAAIRYYPEDPARSDLDLWSRAIRIRGRGGKGRMSRSAMRRPAAWTGISGRVRGMRRRPQLWPGVNNQGPLTAAGIYQMGAGRGTAMRVEVYPHRFRHHFSHTWLEREDAEGDLMELNGWTSPQMLRRYGASARSARARRTYDRILDDSPRPDGLISYSRCQASGPGAPIVVPVGWLVLMAALV